MPTRYDLGDAVTLGITIRNTAGALADATAVALTITLPDGTTTTPSVTKASTGTYNATYSPTTAGRHTARWVATGSNASAFADDFIVEAATTAAAGITRDDLALELRAAIAAADEDAADTACADAWACVATYLGADPGALTLDPWQIAVAQKVTKRVAARFFTNPLDRASFSGPEGLSFTQAPLQSARILTPDERAMLDDLGAPGFA